LTKEIAENESDPAYQGLGERVARIAEEQESDVETTADKLAEYETLVADLVRLKEEPVRLGLTESGEYKLFALMRAMATSGTESEWVEAAKKVIGDLKKSGRLVPSWSETVGGKKPVALLIHVYLIKEGHKFGLCSPTESDPEFVERALEEIKKQIA